MSSEIIRLLIGKKVSLMVALEIAVSLGLLSVGISLMSITCPFVLIPFGIISLVGFGDALHRILSETNFKQRIAQYITDGTVLYRDKMAYKTGDEYERVANDWVNKVASDIHEHRGQSEADQFLNEYPKKQNVSMESEDIQRDRIQNMLSSLTGWLAWLQQRL